MDIIQDFIIGETGELAGSHMALWIEAIMSKAELANLIGNINAGGVSK